MFKQYEDNLERMKGGDFSMLADTHASSSSLKSLSTITAAQAIEDCRRACGGHGYSMASGMASQYADYLPQVTWEGDSYMLTQQTARYLMKIFRKLYMNKNSEAEDEEIPESSSTIEYLQNYLNDPQRSATLAYSGDFHDPDFFVEAFGFRAADMVRRLVQKREIQRRTWNSLLIEMYKTSRAHAQYNLIRNFAEALKNDPELNRSPAVKGIMHKVFELFACYTMDNDIADFLVSGYFNSNQAELVRAKVDELLSALRPQAVPLVDSFKLPDYLLNSALGRSDGEVYRALFDFALAERESLAVVY